LYGYSDFVGIEEITPKARLPPNDPEGIAAISRWLSEATPPVWAQDDSNDPGGDRRCDPKYLDQGRCDPFGIDQKLGSGPVVSLRSTTG
jgi:hypothetical protein